MQFDHRSERSREFRTNTFIIENRIRHRSCKTAVTIFIAVLGYRVTIKHLGLSRPACHSHVPGRGVVGLADRFFSIRVICLHKYTHRYAHIHTYMIPFYRANPDGKLKVIQDRICSRCSHYQILSIRKELLLFSTRLLYYNSNSNTLQNKII